MTGDLKSSLVKKLTDMHEEGIIDGLTLFKETINEAYGLSGINEISLDALNLFIDTSINKIKAGRPH